MNTMENLIKLLDEGRYDEIPSDPETQDALNRLGIKWPSKDERRKMSKEEKLNMFIENELAYAAYKNNWSETDKEQHRSEVKDKFLASPAGRMLSRNRISA